MKPFMGGPSGQEFENRVLAAARAVFEADFPNSMGTSARIRVWEKEFSSLWDACGDPQSRGRTVWLRRTGGSPGNSVMIGTICEDGSLSISHRIVERLL